MQSDKTYINDGESEVTIHKAGWVAVDPYHFLENAYVVAKSGKILETGQGGETDFSAQVIDYGPGILMPCFVNAHTHLELTGLCGKTVTGKGFIPWVKSLIKIKETLNDETIRGNVLDGIAHLTNSGSLVAGEISSMEISLEPFLRSSLSGVWFKEYIGNDHVDPISCNDLDGIKKISVAGHAPHTTSPDQLVLLKSASAKHRVPFCMHLAESEDEVEFLATGKGPWADFLKERGIDFSSWKLISESPIKYAYKLGLLDEQTLAVHLVYADSHDIQVIAENKVNVCICPKSNLMLHDKLPAVPDMLKKGIKPSIGTDSMASNDALNVFQEMKCIAKAFPDIRPFEIIEMGTTNGAKALGLENHFGTLTPGRVAKMVYLPVESSKADRLAEKIVFSDFLENKIRII